MSMCLLISVNSGFFWKRVEPGGVRKGVNRSCSGVWVFEDSKNAGFSFEGKPLYAVAEEQAGPPGRMASRAEAHDLTAGVTGFPIFLFTSGYPRK